MSDIDNAVVDSLTVCTLDGRLEKRTLASGSGNILFSPKSRQSSAWKMSFISCA